MELRKYQDDAVDLTRQSILGGHRFILLVLPTGAGKSIIAGQIFKKSCDRGNKCLFLVHRRNLVLQFKDTLENVFGLKVGYIMAGYDFEKGCDVYVSTIQTFNRRAKLEDAFQVNQFLMDFAVIIIDEAHRSLSRSYLNLFEMYGKKSFIIGMTATPSRSDGRGLGDVYEDLIEVVDTAWLMENHFLVPVRYFVPESVDLKKIKTVMGDYDTKQLAEKVDKPKIVGDVVQSWLKYAEDRKTIVFAVNVKHSMHLVEEFNKNGIPASHLDARSTEEQREAVFEQMAKGDIKVICNVALYQEGMDVPDISCVVMARPTKSISLYRQSVGRGLRTSPGKKDLILIDHGGTVEQNGLVDEKIIWELDGKKRAMRDPKKREKKEKKPVICSFCKEVFEGVDKCPMCGSAIKSFGKDIVAVAGELKAFKDKKATVSDKRRYLGMLKAWVPKQSNSNPKRVLGSFRGKFGIWPHHSYSDVQPIEPDAEFLNYQKHLKIKFAKRKNKQ